MPQLKHSMKGLLIGAIGVGSMSSFAVLADVPLKLQGEFTQGALLIGQTEPGSEVTLNGEALHLTEDGHFVFGFGRDAELSHTLKVVTENREELSKVIELTAREYDIDRIEGVPQETVTPDPKQVARAKQEAEQVWLARQEFSQRKDFLQPVQQPAEGRISGVYGSQRIFNGEPRQPHFGLDIAAPTGTPVRAPWPGRVLLAVPDMFYSGGTLIIDHGYGVTTTYIHLHNIFVKVGEEVSQGDNVAAIGATGRVTGPHLDWRLNWRNERLDPALLKQLNQSEQAE